MDRRIIRKNELYSRVNLSDATIWRLEKSGKFPQRIKLGGASVGWFADEIDEWFSQKSSDRLERQNSVFGKATKCPHCGQMMPNRERTGGRFTKETP